MRIAKRVTTTALCLLLLASSSLGDPTVVDVSYSHRQVPQGWDPDHGVEEGSILATFAANNPIDLAIPDPTFVRTGPDEFQRLWLWNDTDSVTVVFVDEFDDSVEVRAYPAPVYPMDPANHPHPMINIVTDPANLWDPEIGIYVWGNHHNWYQHGSEWERPAQFEFWDAEGNLITSWPIGLRIHGKYSRSYMQKSLRLYFDHAGEPDTIHYDFFDEEPIRFKRLLLRNCRGPVNMICDLWLTSMFRDLGNTSSRAAYSAVFLNGEYWGAHIIRERLDEEWVETTLDLEDSGYILMHDEQIDHGDPDDWFDMLEFANLALDHAGHDFYESMSGWLDMDSYIDWQILNIFAGSSDNGWYNNLCRLQLDDGIWRYVMWDQDAIFREDNLEADYFRFLSAANYNEFWEYYPPDYSLAFYSFAADLFGMFDNLMKNAEFRSRFSHRFDEIVAGPLSVPAMNQRFDDIAAIHDPELEWHAERVEWWGPYSYYSNLDVYKDWVAARLPIVIAQKQTFMEEYYAPVELVHFDAEVGDSIRLEWRTDRERGNQGFTVWRADDVAGPFTPIASHTEHPELEGQISSDLPTDYLFFDTEPRIGVLNHYRLSHTDRLGSEIHHNWIETADTLTAVPVLFINEFLAKNETGATDEMGEHEDWVEIYNPGPEAVELGGMYLSDDLANPQDWMFPDVTIPAGGFVLVWCDDDPDGPLHATFKLSADGEAVALHSDLASGNVLVDSRIFGPQVEDVSEGRYVDGGLPWIHFAVPTPGMSNDDDTGITPVGEFDALRLMPARPNPFNPRTRIAFELPALARVSLDIYDVTGRHVATLLDERRDAGRHEIVWAGIDVHGRAIPSGLYLLRLTSEGVMRQGKLLLLK